MNDAGRPDNDVTRVLAPTTAGGHIVILDAVDDLPHDRTPYCVHGQVTCKRCRRWCWLGDATHNVVVAGEAAPMCRRCVDAAYPPGTRPVRHITDRPRNAGPHDG